MSEEVVRLQLNEILKTIRFRIGDLHTVEVDGIDKASDYIRKEKSDGEVPEHVARPLIEFFEASRQISKPEFPIQVEFTVAAR